MARAPDPYNQLVLTERLDDGSPRSMRREVKVFCSNQGTWIAEFKLGTAKFQQKIGGADAHDALARAKKWLSTPIYKAAR